MDSSAVYAIVGEKLLAMCVQDFDDGHQVELTRGMMVEIKDFKERYSTILIHDYYEKNYVYEHNLYLCKTSALIPVPIESWSFLMTINDPFERANIAKDKAYIEYLMRLKEGDFVTVIGQYFNMSTIRQSLSFLPEREPKDRSLDYQCIVRYIGPVDELEIPGYLFGLELLVNL